MSRRLIILAAVWAAAVGAGLLVPAVPRVQAQQARPEVTLSQTRRWMTELSNWGRWGKDDQLGTLNLITESIRRKALALAKRGLVVSLEQPVAITPKPEATRRDGRSHAISFYEIRFRTFPDPDLETGNPGFSSDIKEYHVHSPMTHLDALCHARYQGKWYNGRVLVEGFRDETGCAKLGTQLVKDGIVTRGVLVDMTRLKNPSRPAGARAYVEDLEAWERQTGLKVSAGDALFVYNAPAPLGQRAAGGLAGAMDISVLPWMKARGVSITSSIRSIPEDPRANHVVPLVAMGLHLLDGPRLDQLAETAARLNQWEFLLVIAAPNVPGSTGELVNPLAMF
jgi:Putative cyclase